MAEQSKKSFQRVESAASETFLFDGDMHLNKGVWGVIPLSTIVEMVTDIQNRVKQSKGLNQAEQVYEYEGKKVVFMDKQSQEKRVDASIAKVVRRRNHVFIVKVQE